MNINVNVVKSNNIKLEGPIIYSNTYCDSNFRKLAKDIYDKLKIDLFTSDFVMGQKSFMSVIPIDDDNNYVIDICIE